MYFGDHSEVLHVEENREHILSTMTQNSEIVTEIDQGFLYIYKKMKLTDWIIVYSTEESSISNAHYIIREVSVLTLIGIFVTCILTICFSDIMSRSLRELTDIVETDDILEHEISVRSYAEITLLSNGLERMRRRINSLLQQVQREQSMKRKTEIALLQEQIKPHFLYNTLFSVIQLCEMNRIRQATEMLRHLSDFYRTGLSKGESIVTIADEMKHLESYLAIQHFRYEDLFDYTIDCDTAVAGCRIPKMSLQPLVENAIYYGIKKRREKGNICIICGTYDGERVFIEVHDDGPGFTGKRFQEIKDLNSDSFGLKNVDARIKYEFGMDCGIEIETKSEDTCVRIWLTMESGSGDGEYEKKI